MRLADGISTSREVKRSSPAWQAAYRLAESSQKFNEWREKNRRLYLDLSDLTFQGIDLSNCDFAPIKLQNTVFRSVDLTGSQFGGVNLNGAVFRDCSILHCNFQQARLARTDFSGHCLDGTNLFETIRDNWSLNDVECSYCWITRDRYKCPDDPERFEPGEFAVAYGGNRLKVRFPDGMQPIDLLALPYHVSRFLTRFQDRKLILTGLSTVGDAGLEFRFEDEPNQPDRIEYQRQFNELVTDTRLELADELRILLRQKDGVIENQRRILEAMRPAWIDRESAAQVTKIYANAREMTVGGEHYNFDRSQIAAAGRGAHAHDIKFKQVWDTSSGQIGNLNTLADQLADLRAALKEQAQTLEVDSVVGEVANAEAAAKQGDGPRALEHLSRTGKWVAGAAQSMSATVAASAIKAALGLP